MTIYNLDTLLSQFWTNPLFHLQYCCFLSCIQVSQEEGKVVEYSHLFKNFPQFVVIYTVKGFSVVNEAEVDFFFFWLPASSLPLTTQGPIHCPGALRFSNSHVRMWELDHIEGWVLKNWYLWIVFLEKALESPLDSKEIKPVNPKGYQSWMFIRKTEARAEAPILWPPNVKSRLTGKDPDAGKDWSQEEKGVTEDEMVGCQHQLSWHEFEKTPGDGEGQGSLVCCSPWITKSQTGLSDWTTRIRKPRSQSHTQIRLQKGGKEPRGPNVASSPDKKEKESLGQE